MFIALTIGTLLSILVLSRPWHWLVQVAVAGVVWAVIAGWLLITGPPFLGGEGTFAAEGVQFAAMLAGMAAKYLWDRIGERAGRNARLSPGVQKVGLELDFWDFLKPTLVSAIVFLSVLNRRMGLSPESVLFGFQNGFFWQTVFNADARKNLVRTRSRTSTGDGKPTATKQQGSPP